MRNLNDVVINWIFLEENRWKNDENDFKEIQKGLAQFEEDEKVLVRFRKGLKPSEKL
jgi:hypothetical protein